MNIEDIMRKIQIEGFFLYSLEMWSDTLDKELNEKVSDGTLQTAEALNIDFHNGAYYYLLSGNPRNVTVQFNGRFSYLAPTLSEHSTATVHGGESGEGKHDYWLYNDTKF